ncbi:hypothetical protein TREES_T100020663 [Tupaia chinensis]|uniref:Uncharacterized protein n=1 Tax=Tupaia chinensis TaxID=246437 RepID=L9KLE0_TUPCH|nr:hypothetical protein TREES_T100020663 [Tupaia chinensis]
MGTARLWLQSRNTSNATALEETSPAPASAPLLVTSDGIARVSRRPKQIVTGGGAPPATSTDLLPEGQASRWARPEVTRHSTESGLESIPVLALGPVASMMDPKGTNVMRTLLLPSDTIVWGDPNMNVEWGKLKYLTSATRKRWQPQKYQPTPGGKLAGVRNAHSSGACSVFALLLAVGFQPEDVSPQGLLGLLGLVDLLGLLGLVDLLGLLVSTRATSHPCQAEVKAACSVERGPGGPYQQTLAAEGSKKQGHGGPFRPRCGCGSGSGSGRDPALHMLHPHPHPGPVASTSQGSAFLCSGRTASPGPSFVTFTRLAPATALMKELAQGRDPALHMLHPHPHPGPVASTSQGSAFLCSGRTASPGPSFVTFTRLAPATALMKELAQGRLGVRSGPGESARPGGKGLSAPFRLRTCDCLAPFMAAFPLWVSAGTLLKTDYCPPANRRSLTAGCARSGRYGVECGLCQAGLGRDVDTGLQGSEKWSWPCGTASVAARAITRCPRQPDGQCPADARQ